MTKTIRGLLLGAALLFGSAPAFAANLSLDGNLQGNCGTVASTGNGTAGTATLNNKCGVITTEALTVSPTASEYTVTLTNSVIAAGDIILFSIANGTNTTGLASATRTTPGTGSATIVFRHLSSANFNGTMLINYFVIKP